jgi:hypothetical protein
MLESCTSSKVFARFLPATWSCAMIVLFTASVACCWRWLASGLPSPPGSAPSLSFSSWTCCWSPVLLLLGLILSFRWTPWCLLICFRYDDGAVKEQWCSCVGSLWFRMEAASPGAAHLSRQLGLYCWCGAASTPSGFCNLATCELCACMLHSGWSHPHLAVLWNCYVLYWFVSQWLKRTDATLGHNTQWCNGKIFALVWEY